MMKSKLCDLYWMLENSEILHLSGFFAEVYVRIISNASLKSLIVHPIVSNCFYKIVKIFFYYPC